MVSLHTSAIDNWVTVWKKVCGHFDAAERTKDCLILQRIWRGGAANQK
jgi:hypothetical protein